MHRTLADRGLPDSLADDLRQDVLVELLVHAGEVANPIGFATDVLRKRAIDRLRAFRRSPVVTLDPYQDPVPEPADPAPGPDELPRLASAFGDATRRRLAGAEPLRARSAALTAVTAAIDAPPLPPDCPTPGQGAKAADGPLWAGVWFAGGADLWADEGDATRQARSRRLREARTVLQAAIEDAP